MRSDGTPPIVIRWPASSPLFSTTYAVWSGRHLTPCYPKNFVIEYFRNRCQLHGRSHVGSPRHMARFLRDLPVCELPGFEVESLSLGVHLGGCPVGSCHHGDDRHGQRE